MEQYTQAPYHLTLKSNGCLILISALSPTELVVASKHSLGTTTETEETANAVDNANAPETAGEKALERQDRAHAEVGREWLKRTLQRSGKTEAELARRLWDENLTAVLEVCLSPVHNGNTAAPPQLKLSSATTILKSTSLPRRITGPVSTCTA
jgi:tRNA ligase